MDEEKYIKRLIEDEQLGESHPLGETCIPHFILLVPWFGFILISNYYLIYSLLSILYPPNPSVLFSGIGNTISSGVISFFSSPFIAYFSFKWIISIASKLDKKDKILLADENILDEKINN